MTRFTIDQLPPTWQVKNQGPAEQVFGSLLKGAEKGENLNTMEFAVKAGLELHDWRIKNNETADPIKKMTSQEWEVVLGNKQHPHYNDVVAELRKDLPFVAVGLGALYRDTTSESILGEFDRKYSTSKIAPSVGAAQSSDLRAIIDVSPGLLGTVISFKEQFIQGLSPEGIQKISSILQIDERLDGKGVASPEGQLDKTKLAAELAKHATRADLSPQEQKVLSAFAAYYHAYVAPFPDKSETEPATSIFSYLTDRSKEWDVLFEQIPQATLSPLLRAS